MFLKSESNPEVFMSPAGTRYGYGPVLLRWLLRYLVKGHLTIITPQGARIVHSAAEQGPEAVLVLKNWRALRLLFTRGAVGFAEAYVAGDWTSPNVTAVIELAAENGPHFKRAIRGFVPVRVLNRIIYWLKPNTKSGSRRNISFHYDLGNEFYRLWLDRTMSYSSALYEGPWQSLEEAQQTKVQRIIDLLQLDGGENILEIGCGWGALAQNLASKGANVTGITLSREQLSFAQAQLCGKSSRGNVEFHLQDYRDTDGRFNRVVSIEMLEAVGEEYWPSYFETLRSRLALDGTAVLQVITIHEDRFESYRHDVEFIQRYIFPGGMLPSKSILAQQAARAGLHLVSAESFGDSYALTLAEWRKRFISAWPAIEKLGFDTRFQRLWEYYLSYCEAGFRTGAIDVGLYVMRGRT